MSSLASFFISLAFMNNTACSSFSFFSFLTSQANQSRFSDLRVMKLTTSRSQNRNLDVDQRLQALTLTEEEIAIKIVQIITKVSARIINDLKKKARQRDYDFTISRILKLEYVANASRSDRLSKITSTMKQVILNNVRKNRNDREKSSALLRYEYEVCSNIILRVLKRNEFRSCKSIMKSDLNAIMMKTRLQFCLRYKN